MYFFDDLGAGHFLMPSFDIGLRWGSGQGRIQDSLKTRGHFFFFNETKRKGISSSLLGLLIYSRNV